ncbi:hypothetical protein PACTADRAFT_51545 [Pachysolen tannophilus NRRL Y-2460]|uniref:Anaphase spindle elongation protein 1 n=1 Tax=Pachysolen tannophilus NRRL Y-2460 TaxID=669874 RepID=A0A1E4TPX4_PACTA|nr:hypothetical protein PACTADRAFT_51545 [Pachysolen tannophilus NRRL Y-2460]
MELQKDQDIEKFDNFLELVHVNIGLKTKTISELNMLYNKLDNERKSRQDKLNLLLNNCQSLWYKLDQDKDEYINKFLAQNNNLRNSSIINFEKELKRLNNLKIVYISKFIEESRIKIEQNWNLLNYSIEERHKEFPLFFNNDESDYNEEMFDLHNDYIEKLNIQVEELKPILSLIDQFNSLLQEKYALEENCKDSSRLLQRNSFRILKEEEKTRSRLARLLPLTINDLKLELQNYELKNKKPFCHTGDSIYYDQLITLEEQLNTKPSVKRKQQNNERLNSSIRSAPSTSLRSNVNRQQPSRLSSKRTANFSTSISRQASLPIIDETPVRRGLLETKNNTEQSFKFGKTNFYSTSMKNSKVTKKRPQPATTPISQILSYSSSPESKSEDNNSRIPKRKLLSPNRAVLINITNNKDVINISKRSPQLKHTGNSILKSPIRTFNVSPQRQSKMPVKLPIIKPNLNHINNRSNNSILERPIQLSSEGDSSNFFEENKENQDAKVNSKQYISSEDDRSVFNSNIGI